MGILNHNVIIATTWDKDSFAKMVEWCEKNCHDLFVKHGERWNGYQTIYLGPDGSKEGWEPSDKADKIRAFFIEELEKYKYDDGSTSWDWVEVGFGEFGQKVLKGNNKNCYGDTEYAGG